MHVSYALCLLCKRERGREKELAMGLANAGNDKELVDVAGSSVGGERALGRRAVEAQDARRGAVARRGCGRKERGLDAREVLLDLVLQLRGQHDRRLACCPTRLAHSLTRSLTHMCRERKSKKMAKQEKKKKGLFFKWSGGRGG